MIIAQSEGFLDTPPLWNGNGFGIQQFKFPKVSILPFDLKPIISGIRLGHQMEYVFKQLIECSEQYDVVLYNLQIIKEKQTLGEIDFILKDQQQDKLIHVELTYKFYLIDPEILDPTHRLIGPNRRDAFFMKMRKIKNKQFPLLHSQAGSESLAANNIDHSALEHQCCFKAQLFQPFGSKDIDIGPLNSNCIVGHWIRFDAFDKPDFENFQYYIPPKSEWVIQPNILLDWKPYLEVITDIKERIDNKNAPMIWIKKHDGTFEKIFIVWW